MDDMDPNHSDDELCSSLEPPLSNVHIANRYAKDWESIPHKLSHPTHLLASDIYTDPTMKVPYDKLSTMDGVSKCFRCIPSDSDSLILHEPDGITWAICEEGVTQLPRTIQKAVYFFHTLLAHIGDLALFSVPSENILLKRDKKRPKVITKILWSRNERGLVGQMDYDSDDINMNAVMQVYLFSLYMCMCICIGIISIPKKTGTINLSRWQYNK